MSVPDRNKNIKATSCEEKRDVVITGANSGLGLCLATLLKESGHSVLGVDLHTENIKALQVNSVIADITTDQIRGILLTPLRHGILINCAGINHLAYLEDLNKDAWANLLAVNVEAPWRLTKQMLDQGLETVVNITSNAAWVPMTGSLAYNASKAALHMVTRQMARELTPRHGLTIFAVAPNKLKGTGMSDYIEGAVPALRNWTPEEAEAYQRKALMHGEETDPWALAEYITFLLSAPHRHRHLSGCILSYGA